MDTITSKFNIMTMLIEWGKQFEITFSSFSDSRFIFYTVPSLQTQTASWFWISHFPLLQPVHVKLLHSVEAWKNWNTFLAFSYYLNSVWKNMHLIKDNQLCKQLFYPQRYGDFFNFHFVIKVKYGNNKEKNIKAWHPIKNRF